MRELTRQILFSFGLFCFENEKRKEKAQSPNEWEKSKIKQSHQFRLFVCCFYFDPRHEICEKITTNTKRKLSLYAYEDFKDFNLFLSSPFLLWVRVCGVHSMPCHYYYTAICTHDVLRYYLLRYINIKCNFPFHHNRIHIYRFSCSIVYVPWFACDCRSSVSHTRARIHLHLHLHRYWLL